MPSCLRLLLCLALFPFTLLAQDGPAGYHLIAKISLPGNSGWDYLAMDAPNHRLYVSHGEQVQVVDTQSNSLVGQINGLSGVHGIAIANDFNRGFISNGKTNQVTVFDLKTWQVLGQVPTGTKPDAILYDRASRHVFAFNGQSQSATVIDAASASVVATIDLGSGPEFAVADGIGHVYVNLEDASQVLQIHSQLNSITARWPLQGAEGPTGLAMDAKRLRLFSACHNQKLAVLDAKHGKQLSLLPIGAGVDAAAFDPETNLVFSSNGEGTLTVIQQTKAGKYKVLGNLATQKGARTMALDPKTHRIYLSVADFGPAPAPTAEHPHPWPSILPSLERSHQIN